MEIVLKYCINYVFLSLKFIIKPKCQYDLFLKHLSNTILGKDRILQYTVEEENRSLKAVDIRHVILHER